MSTLQKLIARGLITFTAIGGGVAVYWGLEPEKSYCLEYQNEICIDLKTTLEIKELIKTEFTQVVDSYCENNLGKRPDPKAFLLHKFATQNRIKIDPGIYDKTKIISDGKRIFYCSNFDYVADRKRLYGSILTNYDKRTKKINFNNFEDYKILLGLIEKEIGETNLVVQNFNGNIKTAEGLNQIIKALVLKKPL